MDIDDNNNDKLDEMKEKSCQQKEARVSLITCVVSSSSASGPERGDSSSGS
jgi:hypothetical protein